LQQKMLMHIGAHRSSFVPLFFFPSKHTTTKRQIPHKVYIPNIIDFPWC